MSENISRMERGIQRRTELLLGNENLSRIQNTKVLIFGLGGVGSWCAEALVRSGIRHITIVDSDRVCVTNCNRQLMATTKTIGQVKVEALRTRLLEINPDAEIEALQKIYDKTTAESFHMEDHDFIIDAIDSLAEKADLILRALLWSEKQSSGKCRATHWLELSARSSSITKLLRQGSSNACIAKRNRWRTRARTTRVAQEAAYAQRRSCLVVNEARTLPYMMPQETSVS